ncbi:MAG: pyridoxamine 5'-phosphate oxidase family protein [Candidatus Binataceae bacterium]
MLIQELTTQECLDLLTRARLGRLACTYEAQPYIVPIYFAYYNDYLYSFSTVGKKIEWMRANPRVCVETDEVASSQQWVSVVVFGHYEELPDIPEWRGAREYARKRLLQRNAIWWEPGYARTILHGTERPLTPCFYRIHIVQISGHRGTPEPAMPAGTRTSMTGSNDNGWLKKALRRVRKRT